MGKKYPVEKTEEEWRRQLSSEAYRVLRQQGTEPPHDNEYDKDYREGTYYCAGCGQALFSSTTKFDSGSGWPSFYKPIDNAIEEEIDTRYGMVRTEIRCSRCGGHIGHVFPDGPEPTNLRYCTKSAALKFKSRDQEI